DDALWMPREEQLRELLHGTFRSLERVPQGAGASYRVTTERAGVVYVFEADDPTEAYGEALLALIRSAAGSRRLVDGRLARDGGAAVRRKLHRIRFDRFALGEVERRDPAVRAGEECARRCEHHDEPAHQEDERDAARFALAEQPSEAAAPRGRVHVGDDHELRDGRDEERRH